MKTIIGYVRVSTRRQGQSGLGIEAQHARIAAFCEQFGFILAHTYCEVETGAGSDAIEARPQLRAALENAKRQDCAILVAKLDRLSRDVAFISGLMARRIPFLIAELGPNVDPFTLHIFAAMAERERTMISERTRAALQAKKAQGIRLGNPTNLPTASKLGNEAQAVAAAQFAEKVMPTIKDIMASGVRTLNGVATALNCRGIHTARGGVWHPATVRNVLHRLETRA